MHASKNHPIPDRPTVAGTHGDGECEYDPDRHKPHNELPKITPQRRRFHPEEHCAPQREATVACDLMKFPIGGCSTGINPPRQAKCKLRRQGTQDSGAVGPTMAFSARFGRNFFHAAAHRRAPAAARAGSGARRRDARKSAADADGDVGHAAPYISLALTSQMPMPRAPSADFGGSK